MYLGGGIPWDGLDLRQRYPAFVGTRQGDNSRTAECRITSDEGGFWDSKKFIKIIEEKSGLG
jgi:hypothetical protein